jgi:hypothetical protein
MMLERNMWELSPKEELTVQIGNVDSIHINNVDVGEPS